MIQAPFVLPNQTQQNVDMSNEELLGKHMSLRKELSAAYTKPSWDAAHTNRTASELAAIERLLTSQKVTRRARSCHPACRVAGLAGSASTSLMSRRQPGLCLVKNWSADRNVCVWIGANTLNERATAT